MGDVYVGCNADSTGGTKLAKVTDVPDTTLFATKADPVFTGSFSLNRTANSSVGTRSFAFNGIASRFNSVSLGGDCQSTGDYAIALGYEC
jgi:hypothetical protein